MSISSLIISIIVFGVIVFIHELGHFLGAIFFGVKVREFAIGFGPKIFGRKGKLANYSLRIVPLGGYVDIAGMEDDSPKSDFHSRPYYQKLIILSGGVIMNFLLSFVIFFGVFAYRGEVDRESYTISTSYENSPFQKNDIITTIDEKDVKNWKEIFEIIGDEERDVQVGVLRSQKKLEFLIEKDDVTKFLTSFPYKRTLGIAVKRSAQMIVKGIVGGVGTIKRLASGKGGNDLTGPIGIVKMVEKGASQGFMVILILGAMISISLGFFNALPIPPLDGGKILFVSLNSAGIKVNKQVEGAISLIGLVLFIGLTLWVGKKDISRMGQSNKTAVEKRVSKIDG